MPVGSRIRANNVFGTITDNPLTVGATTFNSAGLSTLPVVSGNHAVVTLDPLRQFGEPEIVIVTAHTASATVATITRGAYGTTARSHPQGTVWVHAPIDEDFTEILTSSTRPSDPYRGQKIFETDTNRYIGRSTADVWQQEGLFFDPPACLVRRSTDQTINDATLTLVTMDTEIIDTDNMWSAGSPTRITFNTPGLYVVGHETYFGARTDYVVSLGRIKYNAAAGTIDYFADARMSGNGANNMNMVCVGSTLWNFIVGDFIELEVFQDNIANAQAVLAALPGAVLTPTLWAIYVGRGN